MFVVCTGDGLGNQMFHYAFYCALQKKGVVLADYFLNCNHKFLNNIFKIRKVLFGAKDSYITVDDPTVFYEDVFKLSPIKSYMFRGNWINEKYFKDCKEKILNDFTFPIIDDDVNMRYKQEITNSNSVSIHVRRGDYIGSKMGHLGENYFKTAIEYIKEKSSEDLKYFIFTDDPEYVRKEFEFLKDCVFVEGNKGENSFRDMQLMSLCKHNIIANSTFSFWGAYLNRNSEKIIIAPKVSASIYKNPFACEDWILL